MTQKALGSGLILAICLLLSSCFYSDQPTIDPGDAAVVAAPKGTSFDGLYRMPTTKPDDPTYLKITALPDKRYLIQRWLESSGFETREDHVATFIYQLTPIMKAGRIFAPYTAIVSSKDVGFVYYILYFELRTGQYFMGQVDLNLEGEAGAAATKLMKSAGLTIQTEELGNLKLTTVDGSPLSAKQLNALFLQPDIEKAMKIEFKLLARER